MSQKYPEWYELPRERWRINPDIPWERDSQRQKVYNAEDYTKYRINSELKSNLYIFSSIEEVQRFVDKLTASAWIRKRYGLHKIVVKNTGGTWARGGLSGCIRLPFRNKWSHNIMVILHELSHCIGKRGIGACHGRFFARSFLELVGHVLGSGARKILKEEFKNHRVKYTPRKQFSPEAQKALKERGKKLYQGLQEQKAAKISANI